MRQNIKRKNNFRKYTLVLLIVLTSTFLITLFTDSNRLKSNKPPMLSIFISEENGVKEYIGFGYRVFYQRNSFYGITYLWADKEDLSVGDPLENKLKVILSGNLVWNLKSIF